MLQAERAKSSGKEPTDISGGRGTGREMVLDQGCIRVAIADGQSLVRSGVASLLSGEDGIEVVATSSSLAEAVRHLRGHRPDVLLFDPSDEDGVEVSPEAIKSLKEASPQTSIVVVSPSANPETARAALRSGASGFITKGEDVECLSEAVRRASAGEPYINNRLAIEIARLKAQEEADGLTEREIEILRLIALGHTNAEIAQMLFLSVRTVESHRAHILEKLRFDRRSDLVQYAIDKHLIP